MRLSPPVSAMAQIDAAFDAASIATAVADLAAFYPEFDSWYWTKVIPGLADGSRFIETSVRNGQAVAVVIAKRKDGERKISTLWVRKDCRGSGVGTRLLDRACEWLGTDHPLATLPQEKLGIFAPLIHARRWRLTGVLVPGYRPGKTEYIVNGA